MIAIGSLLPRASVDLLLALTSLDSLPCLSSTALGVLCPVGVLLGDRWLRRAFPLRATSRADLGVLVVDALRCLEVIFCHPDFVVLVDFSPLSAVPGEDCEIPTFCSGCGIAVKGELRLSAVALHLCDAGADRISRSFAPNVG